jgi:hypothetical protein
VRKGSCIVNRLIGGLLIFGVIAVGGFVLRDRITGGATELQVGDCFDVPTTLTVVEEVQHHPCTETHTGEVVGVQDYPGVSGDAYPADSALTAFAEDLCVRTFRAYTGRDAINDPELTVGYFYPIPEGWKDGDRELTCYLARVDDGPMTKSFKVPTS